MNAEEREMEPKIGLGADTFPLCVFIYCIDNWIRLSSAVLMLTNTYSILREELNSKQGVSRHTLKNYEIACTEKSGLQ